MAIFRGTKHDDDLTGTTGDDTFDLFKGGNDTASGGDGDDLFKMGASLNAADRLDGGADRDVVMLNGDYSAGVVFDDLTIQNIEVLRLGKGFSYDLTLADGNVAARDTLTINASQLGAGNSLTFDGSAESDGHFAVYGGAGNDTLTGGARADVFHLETGGNDTAHGGDGNDKFYLGGAFTGSDIIDGGAGNDTLILDGDYTGSDLTISDAQVTNVENLDFLTRITGSRTTFITGDIAGGHTLDIDVVLTTSNRFFLDLSGATSTAYDITINTVLSIVRFAGNFSSADKLHTGNGGTLQLNGDYSAGLTLSDANLGGLQEVVFNGAFSYSVSVVGKIGQTGGNGFVDFKSNVSAGHSVFLDLTQSTAGSLAVNPIGAGDLTVKFAGNFSSNDQIDATQSTGATTVELDGDYSAGLSFVNLGGAARTLNNVTTLKLDDGFSYNLAMNEGNGGSALTVDASTLTGTHTLIFDASGDPNALAITGGAGNDTVKYGGNFLAADTFNGGGGSDTLELHGNYSAGYTFGAAQLTSVETLKLDDGFGYKLTTNDGNVAAGATMLVDASALTGTNALSFDASAENGGFYTIKGGAGADSVTFGSHFSVSDSIDGGAGNDTVTLNWDNSFIDLVFTQTTLTNVERLVFNDGGSTNGVHITTVDANVASGATLTVDFSGSSNSIAADFTFDGSAEQDGHFNIVGPMAANTYVVTGGALSDTFTLGDDRTSDNTINGGGGDDTLTYSAATQQRVIYDGGAGTDTIALTGGGTVLGTLLLTSVENLTLDDHTWNITTGNTAVGAGATLSVDAAALTGAHTLTFDGSGATHGNFVFDFAGNFTASDSLTGSTGNDTLSLDGDYSGGVTFGASTISGIENIVLAAGHSYGLTTNDANVAAGATLTVDASALGSGDQLFFSGGNETNGHFAFIGGAGADVLNGGKLSDTFDLSRSDGAFVSGFDGNDTFTLTTRAHLLDDSIDGGSGTDTLILNGDFSTQTALTGANLTSIDAIQLQGGSNSYNLSIFDGIATSLDIDASGAASLTLDASGASTTDIAVNGSNGDDHVTGGGGSDILFGSGGQDILTGGGNEDDFAFFDSGDSTTGSLDTITDFTAGTDIIQLFFAAPMSFQGEFASAAATGTLDGDLAAAFDGHGGGVNSVYAIDFTGADFTGRSFIVADSNGNGQYDAGVDFVIEITGHIGTITDADVF